MTAVQKPLLIALAVLLFFVFNAFNHLVFKDARLDLTEGQLYTCLLYTSPSPRDRTRSRMPSSA